MKIKLLLYRNYLKDYQNKIQKLGFFKYAGFKQFEVEKGMGFSTPLFGVSIMLKREPVGINWDRCVSKVKVKAYPFHIYVDRCLEKAILLIDSLRDTRTCWCCCGHGHPEGSTIEFVSKLPIDELQRITAEFGGVIEKSVVFIPRKLTGKKYVGFVLKTPLCKCSEKETQIYWGTEYSKFNQMKKEKMAASGVGD